MSTSVAAIILTYNEEQHIARCINSLLASVDEIFVIDSYSQDKTLEIAKGLGANVFQNPWKNYAQQFNWALENCDIHSEWIWRIDADEYLESPETTNLRDSLGDLPQTVTGAYIKRKIIFLGRPLLHGGWYPVWHLKIWRTGKAYCENRWMDEHMKLIEGQTRHINCVQVDENLNDLSWWTDKHNSYATREMIDLFDIKYQIFEQNTVIPRFFGTSEQRKRWMKLRYVNLPLFIRPLIYFIYRYIFRFGFLDGKSGLIWHILQGFWYRFLVDTKIFELKKRFKNNPEALIAYLKTTYQI